MGSDGAKPPPPPGKPDDVNEKVLVLPPPPGKPLNPENELGPAPAPGEGPPVLRPSSPNWSYIVRFCLSLRTSKASDI
jgi:hypothetical protein